MALLKTVRFIRNHPLNRRRKLKALGRYLRWQVGSRMLPGDVVADWVGGVRVLVRPGETGMTGNLYCGLHEFEEMAYLLHVLRPHDLFVDVGANVGAYTLLASGAVGARAYAFEPIPQTYERLVANLRINDLFDRVQAMNVAVSDASAPLVFETNQDTMNHVLAAGEASEQAASVSAVVLDEVLRDEAPAVLKVDVEGYETPVIGGALRTVGNASTHSLIMEVNASGNRYGYKQDELLHRLSEMGFRSYSYDPFTRVLTATGDDGVSTNNAILIKDVERVRQLVADAPKWSILGTEI